MSTYFLDLHLVKNINVVRLPLGAFGRRVSFLAKGVIRDSEEAHLLKTVPSGGAWRSEDEGEETLLTSL